MKRLVHVSDGYLFSRGERYQKRARNQGFWTPFAVDRRSLCRTWPKLRIVSGAGAETILHLRPLAKSCKRVVGTSTTENVRARLEIQNLGFGGVFCILFAAAGKKYAAGGRTPQLTRPIPPKDRPFGGLVLFLSCWRGCSRNRHPAWRRRRRRGSCHT